MSDFVGNDSPRASKAGESFCFAPFVQMLLSPTGTVHPCCWHFGKKLGDVNKATLSEIWNGDSFRALRREFLTGEIKTCSSRIKQIGCNKLFERFSDNTVCSEKMTIQPRRLDIRLNGQCNLQCVMCDVWKQPNGTYDSSSFWQDGPTSIFPFLEEIDVLGGEPFIQRDTYRLIKAVQQVNPTCHWSFVTNGQYRFGLKVRSALQDIMIREFQISLDSLNEQTYRDIRRGGELRLVLDTLEKVLTFRREREVAKRGFTLKISMCALKSNWREIPAFLSFCREMDVVPELQFAYYDAKSATSLECLAREEKQLVLQTLTDEVPAAVRHLLLPVTVPLILAVAKGEFRESCQ